MSMYRQLWLAIIVSTLLALLGSLLAATLSARSYLSEQLSIKNADNAAALALSLSQQNPDAVVVELTVSALFDSGHYELIRVCDPFGKTMVERMAPAGQYDVPAWFAHALPIIASPGRAQISNGWKQFGSIELVSHSRFAYQALWKSVWEMVAALAAAGLVGGYLGSLVLRRLRRPLGAVIDQAQAITERRFVTIAEPKVPELRQLAAAMNTAVGRLKTMFEEEAARLETVRREANCDPLTGLANRSHFLARLRANLTDDESQGGSLMLIRVANLAEINHRVGREATDDLLKRVGAAVSALAAQHAEGVGARLNGADYALLLPDMNEPRRTAEILLEVLINECEPFVGEGPTASIGVGRYPHGLEAGAVMAQIDTALAAAETAGDNTVQEARFIADEEAPKTGDEWAKMIRHALDRRWVRLISFPVTDLAGRVIHRECPLRLMLDEHGEWLPAGRFLPMAERLKLTSQLDLAAIALGLEQLDGDIGMSGLAINLSASSIQNEAFRRQLIGRLQQQPEAAARLWLEVSEIGVLHHFDAFRSLVGTLKGTGCRIGIEHFGRQFSQIGLLHSLGLDYLKVDACFIRGLDNNTGNQTFLKGLSGIAHGIGLTVIAEGVVSLAELQALATVGFDGATGPAIRDA
ncbi:MAG TPA: EAL domain-containing protein [Rhodocyclaceae bacterium]|nr:EAL domain-containing protein [Rhodocyclaceae bacterium]